MKTFEQYITERADNFVVTVITQEALKKAKKPINKNKIGKHFSPRDRKSAEKLKNDLEKKGVYEGEKIDEVFITNEKDGMGTN